VKVGKELQKKEVRDFLIKTVKELKVNQVSEDELESGDDFDTADESVDDEEDPQGSDRSLRRAILNQRRAQMDIMQRKLNELETNLGNIDMGRGLPYPSFYNGKEEFEEYLKRFNAIANA
jgi:hypothetical protein